MKKKLFISILPMLMALSACGGAGPNAAAKEEGTFLEDTLAHEEIFGSLDDPSSPIKSIRNLDPTDPSTPAIGVQYYEEYNTSGANPVLQYVSVRYVAAVRIENVATASAKWNRTIYNANGTIHHATASVECEYKYTVIYDGGSDSSGSLSIEEYNSSHKTNYNYFFMYALRRVPANELGGALCSSFTFNNGAGSETTTNVVATRLTTKENSVCAALTPTDLAKKGYYLKGKLGGVDGTSLGQDGSTPSGYKACFTTVDFIKKNDTFFVYYNDTTLNKFCIYGYSSLYGNISEDSFSNNNGKIGVNETNNYTLYLTNADKIVTDVTYTVTFSVTLEDSAYAVYLAGDFNSWNGKSASYKLSETAVGSKTWVGVYELPAGYHEYKFVSYASENDETPNWDGGDGNRLLTVSSNTTVSKKFAHRDLIIKCYTSDVLTAVYARGLLGNWEDADANPLSNPSNDGRNWEGVFELPYNQQNEFKFYGSNGTESFWEWAGGSNRTVTITRGSTILDCNWGNGVAPVKYPVHLSVDMSAQVGSIPEGTKVYLAGSFNGWGEWYSCTSAKNDICSFDLELEAGDYEFKFPYTYYDESEEKYVDVWESGSNRGITVPSNDFYNTYTWNVH